MARGSQEIEQKFLETLQEKTGRDLPGWMATIRAGGLDKPNAIINWLKSEHKLNHSQAAMLAGVYLNGGKPVYDYAVLFENIFKDKEDLLPVYRKLESLIQANLDDVELIPTKTYISIEGKRVFACATPTKKSIRVGMDLGDLPFGDYVQKPVSLGSMPNISHMVEITQPPDVSEQLLSFIQMAYDRVHR